MTMVGTNATLNTVRTTASEKVGDKEANKLAISPNDDATAARSSKLAKPSSAATAMLLARMDTISMWGMRAKFERSTSLDRHNPEPTAIEPTSVAAITARRALVCTAGMSATTEITATRKVPSPTVITQAARTVTIRRGRITRTNQRPAWCPNNAGISTRPQGSSE